MENETSYNDIISLDFILQENNEVLVLQISYQYVIVDNLYLIISYMFFYRFGSSITNNIIQSPPQHTKPGDLIFDGEWYYLNLGDEIARPEQ